MRLFTGFKPIASSLALVALASVANGQKLPGSLGFSIAGSFLNGTAQSADSILLADNNLTNGYASGFDLADAPSALNPTGPVGSAAFQWGVAADWSAYPHTSALWFQPLSGSNIAPEQSFDLGYLFYRNGTIKSGTGATAVDIGLQIAFAQQLGLSPVSEVFGTLLINTPNSSDQVASADVVTLDDQVRELQFQDQYGNPYYLELTFQVDQDTMDNSLSTINEFRVFEGSQGRATLLGRFTTNPIGPQGDYLIPEPSTALMGLLGAALLLRRRR
jgi:hypothetical protein